MAGEQPLWRDCCRVDELGGVGNLYRVGSQEQQRQR